MAGTLVLQLYQAPLELWPGALILAAFASAVSDLDHNQSKAQSSTLSELNNIPVAGNLFGRIITMVLKLSRKLVGKREVTHSLLLAALLWWGIQKVWMTVPPPMLNAVVAGFISHLVIDTFNPEGVRVFWPFGPKISLTKVLPWPFTFKTGSRVEKFVFKPVLLFSAVFIIFGKSLSSDIFK